MSTTLDPYLYVSALKLELGDIFFDQEFNKLFELFLIHEWFRFSGLKLD